MLKKIKFSIIFSITLILSSCMSNEEMEKWSNDAAEIAPLTLKEIKFVQSLKNIGFHTTIEHSFVGRNHFPSYHLIIKSDSTFNDAKNCSELEIFLRNLSNTLYQDIIADSILYDIGNFDFSITGIPLFDDSICSKKYAVYRFSKRKLEAWNHFKVEKTNGKDNYYRRPI